MSIQKFFTYKLFGRIIIYIKNTMEEFKEVKTEATQVKGCRKCNQTTGKTQRFVFITGGIMFALSLYGAVSLYKDIVSLF